MAEEKKQLDRLETKVDKLDEKIDQINETMARNTASLEYHIKRTDLLETKHEELAKKTDEKLEKVEKHVTLVNTIAKVIVYLAGGVASILGFVKLLIELGLIK